jgi:putative Holliday junction resolvase
VNANPQPALQTPLAGTVLAFDFGTRRIGVAIGESLLGQARALATIDAEENDVRFAAIAKLIDEWQPSLLVVGLPRAPDGSENEMTARCRRFSRQIAGRFGLPVTLVDERYTSSEADARLAEQGLNWQARKQQVDAVAAQIILQDYFDAQLFTHP